MNVSLGKSWEEYVSEQVASGNFNNASEVVRDALRRQQEHFLKLEALRRDIESGIESIRNGRISTATPADIKAKAMARRVRA
ncbi:type II toxin-antitoxin system ParD family antitoxin [Rhizobium sp. TH2]|uniref:type II toxin-antitoxin system ParD family antitoxin n=1 Tax=Rhizobium sp. TH2 TaxID=2775403 RepID=UPI002157A7AC|nr:type II toxin-antitoxin system ParD family antitoxin [Rhizobium sp. TH2]UVC11563.1 type II toxin-antitoxin system ParD family antitoxin [Rhizobium sp. TH2]